MRILRRLRRSEKEKSGIYEGWKDIRRDGKSDRGNLRCRSSMYHASVANSTEIASHDRIPHPANFSPVFSKDCLPLPTIH